MTIFNRDRIRKTIRDSLKGAIDEPIRARLGWIDADGVERLLVPEAETDTPGTYYIMQPVGEQPFMGYATNTGRHPLPQEYLIVGTPILVRQQKKQLYVIEGLDGLFAAEYFGGTPPEPAASLTHLNTLSVGMLAPTEPQSMTLQVFAAPYMLGSERYYHASTLTDDFSSSPLDVLGNAIDLPSSSLRAIMVLVQRDPTDGALSYKQGDELSASLTFPAAWQLDFNDSAHEYFPMPDPEQSRVGYVRLRGGAVVIGERDVWSLPDIFTYSDRPAHSKGTVATTDATVTDLIVLPLAEEQSVTVQGMVNGILSGGGAACGATFSGVFRRGTGGNVTLVGSAHVTSDHDSGSGSPAVTLVADTTAQAVVVRVAGVAAENWAWYGDMTWLPTLS